MTSLGCFLSILIAIALTSLIIAIFIMFPDYGGSGVYLTGGVSCGIFLRIALRSKDQFGPILLAVPNAFRVIQIILLPIQIVILGNPVWQDITVHKANWFVVMSGLLGTITVIVTGIYSLFAKIEIRENGIIHIYSRMKWEDIASYSWKGEQLTLKLKNLKS